jgi:hypothetical protein
MSRLDDDLRNLFLRNEEEAPLVDLGEPERMARRTRRRQVLVVGSTTIAVVALLAGALVGIGALVEGGRSTPAQPAPPNAAPVVIERGSVEGWDWVLSASEDGSCVALTDEQGSTTLCPTPEETAALGLPESDDLVGVTVRSPKTPGPMSTFVFGIVSSRTTEVGVDLRSFVEADELTFRRAPTGVDGDHGYFVARIDGFPYPVVPDIVVSATATDRTWADVATVDRPPWAQPTVTLIETVASGSWLASVDEGQPHEWTFGLWRDNASGQLCYPEPSGSCWTDDPERAWHLSWDELEVASVQGTWRDDGFGGALVWGVFRGPVVSVRVELDGREPFEPNTYGPPTDYPDAHRLFVFEYEGHDRDLRGQVVGLDADGDVVETASIDM